MAHWLACVLTGRHQFSMWCERGEMFLRCSNCGRRSRGWKVTTQAVGTERANRQPAERRTRQRVASLSAATRE